jgi:transcriptional regulator with GAF, ATPase, and Fis domain
MRTGSFPAAASPASDPAPGAFVENGKGLSDRLDDTERELITGAMTAANSNIAEAARLLKTDRGNLYRRMRRLGIRGGGE